MPDIARLIRRVLDTPPVDDDFPDVLAEADAAVRSRPHKHTADERALAERYLEWRSTPMSDPRFGERAGAVRSAIESFASGAWFVDCFNEGHSPEFPFASYGPHTLREALEVARNVLERPESGIGRVELGRTTKGANPAPDRWV